MKMNPISTHFYICFFDQFLVRTKQFLGKKIMRLDIGVVIVASFRNWR